MIRTLWEQFTWGREQCILATGAYNLILGHTNIRKILEKRLRQFQTDYIDMFM